MPQLKSSILINAPIEHCFKHCASLQLLVDFMKQSNTGFEFKVDPGPNESTFAPGVTHRIESTNSRMKLLMLVRVEKQQEPNLLVLSGEQSLQTLYTMSYHLSNQEGQTLVEMIVDLKPKQNIGARLLLPLALFLQRAALGVWGQFLKSAAESENPKNTSLQYSKQNRSRQNKQSQHNESLHKPKATKISSTPPPSTPDFQASDFQTGGSQTEGMSLTTLVFVIAVAILIFVIWRG